MKKIVSIIAILFLFNNIEAQTEDTSANALRSTIIDHSGVQPYITAHPMIEKRRPFTKAIEFRYLVATVKKKRIK